MGTGGGIDTVRRRDGAPIRIAGARHGGAHQLFLALPYALTLIVLAFFGGQARDPSALGIPYIRT